MTKKDLIELADHIRLHNQACAPQDIFNENHIQVLVNFCRRANPQFNRQRWLDYIAGKVGPNGGKLR